MTDSYRAKRRALLAAGMCGRCYQRPRLETSLCAVCRAKELETRKRAASSKSMAVLSGMNTPCACCGLRGKHECLAAGVRE